MIAAMRAGDPAGNVEATAINVRVSPSDSYRRILTWTPERTSGVYYHVIIDNVQIAVTSETELLLEQGENGARVAIEVIETSTQNRDEQLLHVSTTPDDRVDCTWAEVAGATEYQLYRKLSGGSYGDPIYEVDAEGATYSYRDGPLEDGNYVYKLVALDEEGDSSQEEEPITISSTPEPPTDIGYSWNAETHVLSVTWTASGSADVDHYAIRHNGGSGSICITDAVEDTEAGTAWTIDLTGLTGEYEFLVRAVDAGGKEEQNLKEILRFNVVAGVAHGIPAFPRFVRAVPSAGGKATITWRYFPAEETGEGAPGVAHEARIYYDNGTGTVNLAAPLATQAMGNPIASANYSWESGVLADDTYLFVVRIATAAHPGGVETQNEDEYEVTTNDDTPDAVDLSVAAI